MSPAYKRWYDHDPKLLEVIELLKNYQDELKALDGKQVTIIAPLYGYHASYGWILGTYLSVEEVK